MSLNIKDPAAHDLARQVAAMNGMSLTGAVIAALQEKLEKDLARQNTAKQPAKKSRYDLLMEFADEYTANIKNPVHSWEINDLLYDEDGLPK